MGQVRVFLAPSSISCSAQELLPVGRRIWAALGLMGKEPVGLGAALIHCHAVGQRWTLRSVGLAV